MLDTLKIRRLGFPFRMAHAKFWETYHVLDVASPMNDVDSLVTTIQGRAVTRNPRPSPRTNSTPTPNRNPIPMNDVNSLVTTIKVHTD